MNISCAIIAKKLAKARYYHKSARLLVMYAPHVAALIIGSLIL